MEECGGLPAYLWVEIFSHTHDVNSETCVRLEWPDGEPYIKQCALMVAFFSIIKEEVLKMKEDERKRQQNRARAMKGVRRG